MNSTLGWLQLALYMGFLLLITKPLGLYLLQVLDAKGRTWLDPIVGPLERLTYRLCGSRSRQRTGLEAVHHLDARSSASSPCW